jgi:ubiquinone/menaquinone biosynthesis C-methylase UbiE
MTKLTKSKTVDLFDTQAATFERRAGLPDSYCREIARAVIKVGLAGERDLLVEIGPGTGNIGQWLIPSTRYIGLDSSEGMLGEFRRRIGEGDQGLVRTDCSVTWPLSADVARVIFSSRTLHLLPYQHVASEVFRVACPGGTLIVGRVKRDPDGLRSRMSREMIERLRRHGFEGRRGEQQTRTLVEACLGRGAELLPSVTVARWKVSTTPRQSLESWRGLTGLGGIPIPAEVKTEILDELEGMAEHEFGRLDRQLESEEAYVLNSVRLPDQLWV